MESAVEEHEEALESQQTTDQVGWEEEERDLSTCKIEENEERLKAKELPTKDLSHKAILTIAHILQQKYVYISGSTDKNEHPLLICAHNRTSVELTSEEFCATVKYLKYISSILWENHKFVVIVDRQYGKWSSVRSLLQQLQIFDDEEIHEVLLLKPQGFLQKHFGSNDPKQIQQLSKHHITFLDNTSQLEEFVDLSCLPDDLGGYDGFNVNEWVEYTTAVERFQQTCHKIYSRLKEFRVLFAKRTPLSSAEEIEEQIRQQQKMVDDILEDIRCATEIADTLTPLIDKPLSHSRRPATALERYNSAQLRACTENLLEYGDEVDTLWNEQIKFHEQSKELCNFEKSFGEISIRLIQITSFMDSKTEVGDSLQSAKELMMELDDFEDKKKEPYNEMMKLKEKGIQMIAFFGVFAKESVKVRNDEIKHLLSDFDVKWKARRELLQASNDVFVTLDQIESWCKSGFELLASQPVEAFNAENGAKMCLAEIENFIKDRSRINMKKFHQLNLLSKKLQRKEIDEKITAALAKIEEVKTLLQKRETSLKKVAHKQDRPVQRVKAIVVKNDNDENGVKDKVTPRTPGTPPVIITPTGGVTKESIEVVVTDDIEKYKRNKTFRKSLRLSFKRPVSSPELLKRAESEEDPEHIKKIRHVVTELIDTELVYVNDLKHVIEGYFYEFDDPVFDIPEHLRLKKNVIFGNIDEIYKFHKEVFLKELNHCKDAPYFVGNVFLTKKEELQLYATYCKNKPKSETLRLELHKTTFSQACQEKLGHPLNLDSYLLKPVQRITKYRLLLTEMLKYVSKKNPAHADLLEALVCMKRVLRQVNDVMHSTGLTGFPKNLDEQGKLLLQDSFTVWEGKKNSLKQFTKLGSKNRQLFLFEKCLIFSKKDFENGRETGTYQYKTHFWTADIGVTETVKGDDNKFEVWVQRTNVVNTLQALNIDVKANWVKEIRKMLMVQFTGAKETFHRKQSTDGKLNEPLSKEQIRKKLKALDPSLRGSTPALFDVDKVPKNLLTVVPDQSGMRGCSSESNLLSDHSSDSVWSDSEFDDDDDYDGVAHNGGEPNVEISLRIPEQQQQPYMHHAEESNKVDHTPTHDVIKFTAVADYVAVEETELSFSQGDLISLIKEGDDGWWYCKHLLTHSEGWAPSGYLELHAVDVTHGAQIENTEKVEPVKPIVPSPRRRLETAV